MLFDLDLNIYLKVFVDEKKKVANRWNYIGMLIVKEAFEKEVIMFLQQSQDKEKVKEMKYADIRYNTGSYKVAASWIDFLCEKFSSHFEAYFFVNILGIDTHKLDYNCFGAEKEMDKYYNPYSRFFRTLLKSSWSHFFKDKNAKYVIRKVFHDSEGVLENVHPYFKRQPKKALKEDESFLIEDVEVEFINSNPSKEKRYRDYSYLIEFIDLILGIVSFIFDPDSTNAISAEKLRARQELALRMREIVQEVVNGKVYHKNLDISFFPKGTYKENGEFAESQFFKRQPQAWREATELMWEQDGVNEK